MSQPADVDEVIMGQVLTAGQGQNPARQAAVAAGIPIETTAWGVNQVCGSGLRAVAVGAQQIATGDADIIVAGGQENMSLAPHVAHLRNGQKMGALELVDSMIKDGLWEAFNGYHMGNTAENVARQWQITREEQDKFATHSQNKAEAAKKGGKFKDEIAPVTVKTRKGETVVSEDEYIREGAKIEDAAKLRPAFDKEGTVTAGNASGINDGAAAVVLMSAAEAKKRKPEAARPYRLLGDRRRRSEDHGLRPHPRFAQGAGEGRLEGRRPRSDRGQRGLRGAGACGEQGSRRRSRQGQRQWRRHRHRPSRSAPPARASSSRCCTRCRSATPRRVLPRSASVAAWASPCASSVTKASL